MSSDPLKPEQRNDPLRILAGDVVHALNNILVTLKPAVHQVASVHNKTGALQSSTVDDLRDTVTDIQNLVVQLRQVSALKPSLYRQPLNHGR